MLEKILRDFVLIAAITTGCVWAFMNRPVIYETLGLQVPAQQEIEVAQNAPETQNAPTNLHLNELEQISSGTVSIRKAADGHFWTDASVNGGHVRFLVDTGASVIALTEADAKKAGIRLNELKYNRTVNTASGQTKAAYVQLKAVSVGMITLRNVDALIIKDGLSTSLLGMSYLGQLQKVEATPQMMILRL